MYTLKVTHGICRYKNERSRSMEIISYKPGKRLSSRCVCVLGFFDGLHLGHRELISLGRKRADELGIPLLLFTFKSESGIKSKGKRIYTEKKKLSLLKELSVDTVALTDFKEISSLSYSDFINDCLIRDFGAYCAVCGFNFHFGKGALGTSGDLKRAFEENGREVIILGDYTLFGKTLSSTLIKDMLSLGDISGVNTALGTPYSVSGEVVSGRGDGTGFGYPTANIYPDLSLCLPRFGVYKSKIKLDGKEYNAITNIGICPTFGDKRAHFESYIFDFSGDIYGKKIEVILTDFIREEVRFESKDMLLKQIEKDIQRAKET